MSRIENIRRGIGVWYHGATAEEMRYLLDQYDHELARIAKLRELVRLYDERLELVLYMLDPENSVGKGERERDDLLEQQIDALITSLAGEEP